MGIKNKRILTLFLTAAVLVALFGCGGAESGNTADDDTELSFSSLEVIPPDNSEIQSGTSVSYPSSFTVLCERGTESELFSSMEDTELLGKTVFERNAMLFEQYGITLTEMITDDIVTRSVNDMLSEDKEYDMLLLSAPSSAALITSGALADLEAVAGWSCELPGYADQVIKELSVGGRTFLAAGDATPSLLLSASAVLVNTELAEKVSAKGDLFSIAENGHFTYETMRSYSGAVAELGGGNGDFSSAIRAGAEDAIYLFLSGGGRFFAVDPVTDVPSALDFDGEAADIYSTVMSLFGIFEDDMAEESGSSASVTPLFNVSSLGELYALAAEGAPFAALPMPKKNVIQDEYYCGIDVSKTVFTALPIGGGEEAAAVMNLIYNLSGGITDSILGVCDTAGRKTAELVRDSMGAQVLTLFGYGDISSFMEACVNERLTAKVFAMRAKERSTAGVAALSIVAEKYTAVN